MKLQKLLSYTRQAIDDYHMISSGDKIAIGISGGKDSLTLLYALANLRKFYPEKFDIVGITVDLGYGNFSLDQIQKLCEDLQVEYHIISTEISKILLKNNENGSSCSLCARLRKGALNEAALTYGCNKVAYGHHMDDMIETALLSLFYEGRFCSFWPVTKLAKSQLTILRPMMYVSEAEVKGFDHKYQLPVSKNPCPLDGNTKRSEIKHLIAQLQKENPQIKKRIFHAITNGDLPGWPEKFN